jgi:hypothetical protein
MPVKIRKLPHSSKFRVWNDGKIVAKKTTKKKAEAQSRLLRGLEHGMKLRKK